MHTDGDLRLVVGNRRTASWSLASWLALDHAGVDCAVDEVDLFAPDRRATLAAVSPTGSVPVLVDHGTVIWESLAILEWAAERAPDLWPAHARRRAAARSVLAELQTGFAATNRQLAADWFARHRLKDQPPARVQVELHRLHRLWDELLVDDHAYLFGARPTVPDLAMVPMAGRLRTYGLMPKDERAKAYVERLLALEPLERWFADEEAAPARPTPSPLVAPARPLAGVDADCGTASPATAPARQPQSGPAVAQRTTHGPSGANATGARRLEEIVARARLRDRAPPPNPAPVAMPERESVPEREHMPDPAAPAAPPDRGNDDVPPPPPEPDPQGQGRRLPWLRRRPPAAAPAPAGAAPKTPAQTPASAGRRRPPRRG